MDYISLISTLVGGGAVGTILTYLLSRKKHDDSHKSEMMKYTDEMTQKLQSNLMQEIERLNNRIHTLEEENDSLRKRITKING